MVVYKHKSILKKYIEDIISSCIFKILFGVYYLVFSRYFFGVFYFFIFKILFFQSVLHITANNVEYGYSTKCNLVHVS